MLPFIGRPRKTTTLTQSSEHGVVATGKHVELSGRTFVERHIRLLSAPEMMEQHGELACYSDPFGVPMQVFDDIRYSKLLRVAK